MHRSLFSATTATVALLAGLAYAQTTTPSPDQTPPQTSGQSEPPAAPDATGAEQPDGAAASTPQDFATMVAQSDMFEIESSRIALEKAQEDGVRAFAQQMVDDHTASSEAMKQAAEADGVNDVPTSLDAEHQQMMSQLQDASADQFDNAYMQMQLQAHQQAVTLFSGYTEQQGALADFADTALPKLQEHLEHAQQLTQ